MVASPAPWGPPLRGKSQEARNWKEIGMVKQPNTRETVAKFAHLFNTWDQDTELALVRLLSDWFEKGYALGYTEAIHGGSHGSIGC